MKTYIHYGHKHFDKELFQPIENENWHPFWTKPIGGFWASDIKAKYGWKDWNENNEFRKYEEDDSFKFKLKDNANVLEIHSYGQLKKIAELYPLKPDSGMLIGTFSYWKLTQYLDFEKLLSDGYDAIELFLSDDYDLYYGLYGWDCDSILVMNPNIVKEIKER